MDHVIQVTEPAPHVGKLLIARPPFNILGPGEFELMERAISGLKERDCRVVVIGSAIPNYFIGHGSLEGIIQFFDGGQPTGDPLAQNRLYRELDRGPLISIAAIDGQCWGGGAELAWACDFRVASTAATFAQPEVNIGLTPGWGGAVKTARLFGEAVALRLALDGRPLDGSTAHRLGIVHEIVPGDPIPAALELARWLAGRPPEALRANKELIKSSRDLPLKDALQRELQTFAGLAAQPATMERIKRAQSVYDAGGDSESAFGLRH